MNTDKVKIQNKTTHNVGIRYSNGIEKNITPNMILEIPKSEFEYLASGTKLFTQKHLTALSDEAVESVGLDKEEVKFETDEEIINKLVKSKMSDFVKYLDGCEAQHLQFRIVDIIKKNGLLDTLPATKISKINSIFNIDLNAELEDNE